MATAPPRIARALLGVSIPRALRSTVLRDLDEVFDKKVREIGAAAAARWYRREAASCAWRFAADRVTFGGRGSMGVSTLDLKLAGRMILKSPGLTLVGGLAIATAIAVTVLAFELVNDIIRPSLPLPNSDRVVTLQWFNPRTSDLEGRLSRDLYRWQSAHSITAIGGYVSHDRPLSTGDGAGELIRAAEMTASGFAVAGVAPLFGRTLVADDERPGGPEVMVASYDVWSGLLNSDPGVVGRVVHFGGTSYSIVGVMPSGFGFPVSHKAWIPLRSVNAMAERFSGPPLRAFARLKPGVTSAAAARELQGISAAEPVTTPELAGPDVVRLETRVVPYAAGLVPVRALRQSTELQSILVLILMMCAANVATLVFARTATRQQEIAVRAALGATRARILVQFFFEALALAVVGAAVGMGIVTVVINRVMQFVWSTGAAHPFWWDDRIASTSYAYAAALTLLIALICGITPALKGTRRGVSGSLQAEGRSTSAKFGATWTTVIVVQVALMVMLLPPALSQAWQGFRARPGGAGFAAAEYLSAFVLLNDEAGALSEDDQRMAASLSDLEGALRAAPFVTGVTFASTFPGTLNNASNIEIEGVSFGDREKPRTYSAVVAPNFFATLDVPVLTGRDFTSADADHGLVVIINQQFLAQLDGRNPIGRHIRRRLGADPADLGPPMEIVGVVRDLGFSPLRPDDAAGFYEVARPGTKGVNQIAVHLPAFSDGPGAFAQQLRQVAFKTNPHLLTLQPLPLHLAGQAELVAFRVFASAMFFVAVMGVVLSTAGVYSMMSFTVSRRTREIAIRAALGADSRRVITAIFSRAVVQLSAGAGLGVALIVYMRPEFAKEVWLPVSLGLFMMVVGAFACLVPARRALRIQPSDALKDS